MSLTILAIESSCDDTSAAIVRDGAVLSNKTATKKSTNCTVEWCRKQRPGRIKSTFYP
nr:hypothetical protein [Haliscomenobacter sp.]